jgi:hypothetical protein
MVPGGSPLLSGGELGAIEAFVRDGGGLTVLATGPPHATSSPPMSRPRPAHGGRPARADGDGDDPQADALVRPGR